MGSDHIPLVRLISRKRRAKTLVALVGSDHIPLVRLISRKRRAKSEQLSAYVKTRLLQGRRMASPALLEQAFKRDEVGWCLAGSAFGKDTAADGFADTVADAVDQFSSSAGVVVLAA